MRTTYAALFVLLIAVSAAAQPAGPIIGSVEIPALYEEINKGGPDRKPPRPVKLYARPADDAPVAATITDPFSVERVEHGYEELSASVFERKSVGNDSWWRVRYKAGGRLHDGWLSRRDAGRFRTLPELVVGGYAFLTDAWDRVLYTAPGAGPTRRVPRSRDTSSVAVASATQFPRTSNDPKDLWLLVVILDGSFCEGGPEAVVATGWIRAHSASGKLTTWHYSRGC